MAVSTAYNYLEPMLQEVLHRGHDYDHHMITNKKLVNQIIGSLEKEFKKDEIFRRICVDQGLIGSVADRLKVEKPDEFDVEFNLKSGNQWRLSISNNPGFVNVFTDPRNLHNDPCRQFFTEKGCLSVSKLYGWFQSICAKALAVLCEPMIQNVTKNGPAVTLRVTPFNSCAFNVDIVPKFIFGNGKQPVGGYRTCYENFTIVPQHPKGAIPGVSDIYWRISFIDDESRIMFDNNNLKNSIRLMKVLVQKQGLTKIKGYFIKTCSFWILQENNQFFNLSSLSMSFTYMLKELYQYMHNGVLPDYWNQKHNLIASLSTEERQIIVNILGPIIRKIESTQNSGLIRPYFYTQVQH